MADSQNNDGSNKGADGDASKISGNGTGSNSNRGNFSRGKDRGGRGRGGNRGKSRGHGANDRGPRKDLGRGEWGRNNVGKRPRNNDDQASKRRKVGNIREDGQPDSPFTKEEIDAEARKPKKKVAVMIGYAGSGYKGMQINGKEKTIEGDLFNAFVAAGAISKANADDPKKSSLVRCARTDKGVHAAGNVISLKLIVEDPNVVDEINKHLPPQIRVWGFERTNGSFSCYQTCDSRWYEYLIPTYSFIPPSPDSFLGKKLQESAEKEGIAETYQSLQEDAAVFWPDAEENYIKPILDKLDADVRSETLKVLRQIDEEDPSTEIKAGISEKNSENVEDPRTDKTKSGEGENLESKMDTSFDTGAIPEPAERTKFVPNPVDVAVKEIKAAYITAKKAYRISSTRQARVQEALNQYIGTRNFHNYTVQKTFKDPSANRVIRSFQVAPEPIIINDTEWLSLKVHGQSFMMHQIRKMVAMAALVVRCGSPISIIKESYSSVNISIPKAPGLGLLLERPVFDSYNERALREFEKEKIDFDKYKKEMDEFKQREIYDRIFREEERDHQFHVFFRHLDYHKSDYFLWVTASGVSAARQGKAKKDDISDDEVDVNGEEG